MEAKQAQKTSGRTKGLPKFDSNRALVFGIFFGVMVFAVNLWSLIELWNADFFPDQLANILGIVLGIGLAIHSVDMMGYYRKHGRLGTDQRR